MDTVLIPPSLLLALSTFQRNAAFLPFPFGTDLGSLTNPRTSLRFTFTYMVDP